MKSNIALIGMMGTYKSTVGKKLADILGMHFLDCDAMLEYEQEMSVSQIFELKGEKYFRKHESKLLVRVSDYENTVISCGGGSVLNTSAMRLVCNSSIVLLLTANAKSIYNRLRSDKSRPLLKQMTIKKISEISCERESIYLNFCDKIFNTDNKSSDEVTKEIIDYFIEMANNA